MKRRQNVQNSSRTPGVSLPSFEHSDIISMVGKSIDHGKLIVVDLFFLKKALTLTVVGVHFR